MKAKDLRVGHEVTKTGFFKGHPWTVNHHDGIWALVSYAGKPCPLPMKIGNPNGELDSEIIAIHENGIQIWPDETKDARH